MSDHVDNDQESLEQLRSFRLPLARARRRCLRCWLWSPPGSEWCLHCSTCLPRITEEAR